MNWHPAAQIAHPAEQALVVELKSWALVDSTTAAGYHYWPRMRNKHGPFNAAAFKSGTGPNLLVISKSIVQYMDAYASSDHIGMIYSVTSNSNTDLIIEARGESWGTGIWAQAYKGASSYGGVRRGGGCVWNGTCS